MAPLGSWLALETSSRQKLLGTVPRPDLAAFILEALGDDATIGKAIGITSPHRCTGQSGSGAWPATG